MLFRALKSFSGKLSMFEGEVKEILEKNDIIDDLLRCNYIEQVIDKSEKKAEKKAVKKKTPKGE